MFWGFVSHHFQVSVGDNNFNIPNSWVISKNSDHLPTCKFNDKIWPESASYWELNSPCWSLKPRHGLSSVILSSHVLYQCWRICFPSLMDVEIPILRMDVDPRMTTSMISCTQQFTLIFFWVNFGHEWRLWRFKSSFKIREGNDTLQLLFCSKSLQG